MNLVALKEQTTNMDRRKWLWIERLTADEQRADGSSKLSSIAGDWVDEWMDGWISRGPRWLPGCCNLVTTRV